MTDCATAEDALCRRGHLRVAVPVREGCGYEGAIARAHIDCCAVGSERFSLRCQVSELLVCDAGGSGSTRPGRAEMMKIKSIADTVRWKAKEIPARCSAVSA